MESPKPVPTPTPLVVKPGSKTFGKMSSGMARAAVPEGNYHVFVVRIDGNEQRSLTMHSIVCIVDDVHENLIQLPRKTEHRIFELIVPFNPDAVFQPWCAVQAGWTRIL